MKSVKCPRCGLVGSSVNERCRRCEATLAPPEQRPQQAASSVAPTPPQASHAAAAFDSLKQCRACYFVHSRSAEACPNCGHQTTLSLVAKGISKGVAAVLILMLLSVLFGAWRFYSERAAATEAQLQMMMPESGATERPPEKPWFWSLFRSQPTVEEILEQHTKASGAQAYTSITSQRASGDISIINHAKTPYHDSITSTGKVVFQTKSPNKAEAVMEIAEHGPYGKRMWARYGFDGARGWESVVRSTSTDNTKPDPLTGRLRESGDSDLELVKQFGVLMRLTRPRDFYSSLVLTGRGKVGRDVARGNSYHARDTYSVRGLSKENRFETFYFDIVTGLLVRHDFEAVEGGKTFAVECYLEDYRDVGGVQMPFTVVYKVIDLVIIYKLNEHRLNGLIDDVVFKMPAF